TVSDTRDGANSAWTINLSGVPGAGSDVLAVVATNNWQTTGITVGTGWNELWKDMSLGSEAQAQIQVRSDLTSTDVLWDLVRVHGWDMPAAAAAIEIK